MSWFKKLRREWNYLLQTYWMERMYNYTDYMDPQDRPPTKEDPEPALVFWQQLQLALPALECKFMHGGHDLHDEGYAGPESGAIDLVCQRCGYSYHHQLY